MSSPAEAGPLAGRGLVVIGGTSGLGRAVVQALLDAGARVVAVGRDDEHAAAVRAAWGDRVLVRTGDAAAPDTAASAVADCVARAGALHGLCHVAGGSGRAWGDGPLHALSDDGWSRTLELNLTSAFLSNRAAVRQFLAQGGGGSVLNVTSVLAFAPAPTHFATHAYAAAKAGLIGLTTSAAAGYAPHNIRFNALAPGLMDTPMARRAAADPGIVAYARARQPLEGGRLGRAEDVAGAAVYFLSDASRFVTGQVLAVDGGWSVSDAAG